MVRNRRERTRHSSACKANTVSQIHVSSLKDLTLVDGPVQKDPAVIPPKFSSLGKRELGFPDCVYMLAASVFQNNHLEKTASHCLINYGKRGALPLLEVKDEEMQMYAYELAFRTLKYQQFLEDIMIDSRFNLTQPMLNLASLAAVMLYDFQDRKFRPRDRPGDEFVKEVRDLESCLQKFSTKLAASMARYRVKNDLQTIDCALPESLRTRQRRASRLPLYTWVNTLKSSLEEVRGELAMAGFSQVASIRHLEGQTFCQDLHCHDVLVFPGQMKATLHGSSLFGDLKLIVQDKACCLGPNAVRHLLAVEGDVLMVGSFSGLTVSHTAALVAPGQSRVYACVCDRTKAQREDLQRTVTNMGCKNVKLIPDDFQAMDGCVPPLQKVQVILLTPQCSLSAISNPVDFILRENRDRTLLQDLTQVSMAQSKLLALVALQKRDIDHALKFPKVQKVVYTTCSMYPEENEDLVRRALDEATSWTEQQQEARMQIFRESLPHFLGMYDRKGPFFRLESSEDCNGCFLAILIRESEPVVVETPQEVLAKANAKGLLDKIVVRKPFKTEQRGGARLRGKLPKRLPSQSRPTVAISSHSRANQSWSSEISGKGSGPRLHQRGVTVTGVAESGETPEYRKTKAPYWQRSKSLLSNASTFPKLSDTTPGKSTTQPPGTTCVHINGHPPISYPSTPHPPACPVTSPVACLSLPPPKVRFAVLRPVTLTLPPVQFPDFQPSGHRGRGGAKPTVPYSKYPPVPVLFNMSVNKFVIQPRPLL